MPHGNPPTPETDICLLPERLPQYHQYYQERRLKELRQQQNISQRILAARLTLSGVEFNDLTILRIEKGERFVPDYEIAVIADYFKVSADYLLGRAEQ